MIRLTSAREEVLGIIPQAGLLIVMFLNEKETQIACALRIELLVAECIVPPHIVSISFHRESRRVVFKALSGTQTSFHAVAPAPKSDAKPAAHFSISLLDENGKKWRTVPIELQQLLSPGGRDLLKPSKETTESNSDDTKESHDDKYSLKIVAAATVLTDPVNELPTMAPDTLELSDYRPKAPVTSRSGKKSVDDCSRVRYAVPPVNLHCSLSSARAVPIIAHIESPRGMCFWSMQRPEEDDSDEEGYFDTGDGVMAPKRNINKLRMAYGTEKEKLRIPARNGKMSLLQACFLRPVESAPPLTISLGRPISFSTSTVLDVSSVMEQNIKYIEDVEISDSESEKFDDDDETEINFENDEDVFNPNFSLTESDVPFPTESSAHSFNDSLLEDYIEEPPMISKIPSIREKIQRMMSFESGDRDKGGTSDDLRKVPSLREKFQRSVSLDCKDDDAKMASDSQKPMQSRASSVSEVVKSVSSELDEPVTSYAPLMKRVDEAEREKKSLEQELLCAHAERDRLVEQLSAMSLISRCASLEAQVIMLRESNEKLTKENNELSKRMRALNNNNARENSSLRVKNEGGDEKDKKILGTGEYLPNAEYERLLAVIASLREELDRQPATEHIVEELMSAKQELVMEKIEKENLARELGKLKGTTGSPTRISTLDLPTFQ